MKRYFTVHAHLRTGIDSVAYQPVKSFDLLYQAENFCGKIRDAKKFCDTLQTHTTRQEPPEGWEGVIFSAMIEKGSYKFFSEYDNANTYVTESLVLEENESTEFVDGGFRLVCQEGEIQAGQYDGLTCLHFYRPNGTWSQFKIEDIDPTANPGQFTGSAKECAEAVKARLGWN